MVSIHMVLVYLNFKLQGLVAEVKEVAVFVLHRQRYAIYMLNPPYPCPAKPVVAVFGSEPFQRASREYRIVPRQSKVCH